MRIKTNLRPHVLPAIAVLVTALAYLPSIASYYYQDDWGHLTTVSARGFNPWVPGGWFFRPLFLLVFGGLYHTLGLHAPAWHLVALAVHLANVYLVYRLATRLGFNSLAAASGAAIFGLYPVTTDAVMWLSALSGVMAAFFCLVSAHIAIDHRMPPLLRGFLCAAVWTAALFAKEEAASLILVLPLLPLLAPVKRSRSELLQWALSCLLFLAGLWLLLHFERQCTQHLGNVKATISINVLRRAVTSALWNINALPVVISSTLLGAVGVLALPVALWWRYPRLRPGLLWFCGSAYTLGVILGALTPTGRYVYIPSVGLGLSMAALVERLQLRDGAIGLPIRVLVTLLVCCAVGAQLSLGILLPACIVLYMLRNDGTGARSSSGSACLAILASGLIYRSAGQIAEVCFWSSFPPVLGIVTPLALTVLFAFVLRFRTGVFQPWPAMAVISVIAFSSWAVGIVEVVVGIVVVEVMAARSSWVADMFGRFGARREWVRNYCMAAPVALIGMVWFVSTLMINYGRCAIGQFTMHLVESGASVMRNLPSGATVECFDDAMLSSPEPRVLAIMTSVVARRPDLHAKWMEQSSDPRQKTIRLPDTGAYRIHFYKDGNVTLTSPKAGSTGHRGNGN